MSPVRFTILIPTRDRCETLRSTIASCVAQDYDNLEIIVSDNVSVDATADVVASFDDPRLRRITPDRRLSMSGNFEFAMAHASDGYLMHLGDDDGLIPGAIDTVAQIVAATKALAVTSSHAVYHWPNSLFESRRNILTLSLADGFEVRDTRTYLEKVARFELGYPELPGTYSSFVSKALLDRAKRDGRYFHSITPDCYSCFLNASMMKEYVYSFRPFAISGISGRSNGASQVIPNQTTESDRYRQENDIPVHPAVVYCPQSVQIVVGEAFLQAREQAPDLAAVGFEIERLCHVALRDAPRATYPIIRQAVDDIRKINLIDGRSPASKSMRLMLESELAKTKSRLRRLAQGYRRIDCGKHGGQNIHDASRLAAKMLEKG